MRVRWITGSLFLPRVNTEPGYEASVEHSINSLVSEMELGRYSRTRAFGTFVEYNNKQNLMFAVLRKKKRSLIMLLEVP